MLSAQTTIPVGNGDDLIKAVADAADGDIIELSDGIHKANYDYIRIIDKSVTIKAADGAHPIVYFERLNLENSTDGTTPVGLTLDGVEFSGFQVDSLTGDEDTQGELIGEYFINLDGSLKSFTDIIVKNCTVRNVKVTTVRGDRSTYTGNGFEFDNDIIYDVRDANNNSYGPFRLKKNISFDYLHITNCTFYNIVNKIIDVEDQETPGEVILNNCTFYNFGGANTGLYLFDFKAATSMHLEITNCIFSKLNREPDVQTGDPVEIYGFRFPADGPDIYTKLTTTAFGTDVVFDKAGVNDEANGVIWDVNSYVYLETDPQFADPQNGDFTLPENSDLLQASIEGTIIGDPRWGPNATGIFNNAKAQLIKIYPNPTATNVFVQSEKVMNIHFVSTLGQTVKQIRLNEGINKIDVSGLNEGVYFIMTAKGQLINKLVVQ